MEPIIDRTSYPDAPRVKASEVRGLSSVVSFPLVICARPLAMRVLPSGLSFPTNREGLMALCYFDVSTAFF